MAFSVNLARLRPQLIDELREAAAVEHRDDFQIQLFCASRLVPGTVDTVEPEYHVALLEPPPSVQARARATFGPALGSRLGAGPFARLPRADIVAWIERTAHELPALRARHHDSDEDVTMTTQ